jgi:hypothetical protein
LDTRIPVGYAQEFLLSGYGKQYEGNKIVVRVFGDSGVDVPASGL